MNPHHHPDLAPVTRHLRAMYSSQLLVAAVHHLNVFELLQGGLVSLADLKNRVGLAERPAMVLFPALCAMGLLRWQTPDQLALTEMGSYLTSSSASNLIGYAALEKNDPGVSDMAQCLLNDGPPEKEGGIGYVKEGDAPSPMDDPEISRFLTLALAGRARILSPLVAAHLSSPEGHLLDVAGGTGLYTYEFLLRNPQASATVMDRPEVLKVAGEFLESFSRSGRPGAATVPARVQFLPGDMLTDELPQTGLLLAASLFHDWPAETCQKLTNRFAAALKPGGQLWVHDAFLDDTLDGPLAVTDYSAALFRGTKGRCYSRLEYGSWFAEAGLENAAERFDSQMEYGLIYARKPSQV